jgi:hypothetical protein
MKHILTIVCFLFSTILLKAQINLNLSLSGRPPANLTEWGNRKDVLTLIVGPAQSQSADVKIKTTIKTLDGTVIGATNLNTAKTFTPSAGVALVLNALDVLPLENVVFTGKYQSALTKTGKLPANNYMLCVQLLRATDFAPASAEACKTFYLAAYQLPILTQPSNEQELNAKLAQTAITFRWTPVVPASPTPVTYRLRVFEILENQHDVQALRSNQPLLDKNIIGTTQFIWQPQLSMMPYSGEENKPTDSLHKNTMPGKKFIWTIQTLDNNGLPLNQTDGNGESLSEPKVFYVTEKKIKG